MGDTFFAKLCSFNLKTKNQLQKCVEHYPYGHKFPIPPKKIEKK